MALRIDRQQNIGPSRFLSEKPFRNDQIVDVATTQARNMLEGAYLRLRAALYHSDYFPAMESLDIHLVADDHLQLFKEDVARLAIAGKEDYTPWRHQAEKTRQEQGNLDFLEILDRHQQRTGFLDQETLRQAKELANWVHVQDNAYGFADRLTKKLPDGRHVTYLLPIDKQGKIHLVKVVSYQQLSLARQQELSVNTALQEALPSFNTAVGGKRLEQVGVYNLPTDATGRWYSQISLVWKDRPYPNAPETQQFLSKLPFSKDWDKQQIIELPNAA